MGDGMNDEITKGLQNKLLITAQNTIAKLGFMSDDCGNFVREALGSDDHMLYFAVGLSLENCIEDGSYKSLEITLDQHIARRNSIKGKDENS